MVDILIVGGGTAGLTAALYALRAGKSVRIVEAGNFGGQITTAPRVENYPGIAEISGFDFAQQLFDQVTTLGAQWELDTVQAARRDGDGFLVVGERGEYAGRSLILATGAKHRHLGVDREQELAGRGVSYCAVCDGAFFKGKRTAVVGGGSAALQSAAFLAGSCEQVTLIHRRDALRGEEHEAQKLRDKDNVALMLNSRVTALQGDETLTGITVEDIPTGAQTTLMVDGLFIAVGQAPDNQVFADLVALDSAGYIQAGEDCITTAPGVFTAGDCRTKAIRQLTTAAADGTVAALAACRYVDAL